MIAQDEILKVEKIGFDAKKYAAEQKAAILKRISKFSGGKLYLEVGGKFLFDAHAARVLPGFDPAAKRKIFADLTENLEIVFCVSFRDLLKNRQLSNRNESYANAVLKMIFAISEEIKKPKIVINFCEPEKKAAVEHFINHLKENDFEVFRRFAIENYPHNLKMILSRDGFGRDDFIQTEKNLVLVTGAASNSGKMSTCLGQIYRDHEKKILSGYAKFETFPIWNLPIDHPVNLAYEAATADIGDFNCLDPFSKTPAVNYNRDVDAFKIVMRVARQFLPPENEMRKYQSPTEMGINCAGFAIVDDEICQKAAIEEIKRRRKWYAEIVQNGFGDEKWLKKCDELLKKANAFQK